MKSKTIALVAVCSAVAVVFAIIANFSPANVVPLAVCSLAFILAFRKSGIAGGLICVAVSLIISGLICGFSMTYFFLLIVFAPYSVFAHLARRLAYARKTAVWRIIAAAVFFYATALGAVFASSAVLSGSVLAAVGRIGTGGPFVVAAIFTVAATPADFLITGFADYVCARIK